MTIWNCFDGSTASAEPVIASTSVWVTGNYPEIILLPKGAHIDLSSELRILRDRAVLEADGFVLAWERPL